MIVHTHKGTGCLSGEADYRVRERATAPPQKSPLADGRSHTEGKGKARAHDGKRLAGIQRIAKAIAWTMSVQTAT